MTRTWLLVYALALAACGGTQREVSKIRYTSDVSSACPDNKGCELQPQESDKFIPPDDSREVPSETVASVVAAKPAEATCANAAIAMASIDVGNYATDEERAPVIAKYETACTRYKFKDTERACLFGVREKWHVAYCVPRLMPETKIEIVDAKQCDSITTDLRARLQQWGNQQPLWAAQVDALDASCRQDRWPVQLGQCARYSYSPHYGNDPLMSCHQAMPGGWLSDQIKLRIEAAVSTKTGK
jgi:hypothetical protein